MAIVRTWVALHCVAALLASGAVPVAATAANTEPNQDIRVRVQTDGLAVVVEVDCPVEAPSAVVWDVLTDYEHMSTFISNIESSTVQERSDNVLRVHQKGKASRGPLTVRFDYVRQVELVPSREIRSHLISGDLKASDFVTTVVADGAKIHIVNKGRYIPNIWIPPFIGVPIVEAETRKQFGEIRSEILRRSAMTRPQS